LKGNLLIAKLKRGSSFTWQSTVAGLQNFKCGRIWRICDGTKINIWEDSWIPASPTKKMMTPRSNILVTTVNDLIDPMIRSWDEELICNLFWSIDAKLYNRYPHCSTGDELMIL
jgi:hypothetical protein